MAELVRNSDGTFQQAEFQSQVRVDEGLPYQKEWPAYMACVITDSMGRTKKKSGSPYFTLKQYERGVCPSGGETPQYQFVTGLSEGCVVGFKYLDFVLATQEEITVFITMRNAQQGRADMYFDGLLFENRMVSISIANRKDEETYCATFHANSGKRAVYFRFYGQKKDTDFISFSFKAA
jgi:hypothetical protein